MQRNVSAKFKVAFVVGVVQTSAHQVGDSELWIVGVGVVGLHHSAVEIPPHRSEELSPAGLGDQLHDAAANVPVLRLKTPCLDLHLFHE